MKALLVLGVFFASISATADEAKMDLSGKDPVITISSQERGGTTSELFAILMAGGATRAPSHFGSKYGGQDIDTSAFSFSSPPESGNITNNYQVNFRLVVGKSDGVIIGNMVTLKGEVAHELSNFVSAALSRPKTLDTNGEVNTKAKFVSCSESLSGTTAATCSVEVSP